MGLFEEIYLDIKKTGSGVAKAIFFTILFALFFLVTVIGYVLIGIGKFLNKLGFGFVGDGLKWVTYTLVFPGFDKESYPLANMDGVFMYISFVFVSAVVCFIIAFKTCRTLKGCIIIYLILFTVSLILWGHVIDPAGFHS